MRIGNGDMLFRTHCKDEMTDANANAFDVFSVIWSGVISRSPEWDAKYENWKYRIEGSDVKGESLTVIAAIDEIRRLLYFVTVF